MMLILNKPAGVPVHAGPGGGPNLEQEFEHLRFGLPQVPHLAHRLDRDTSGCLILGRHHKALSRLGKLFMTGHVEKTYWAVVRGAPPATEGTLRHKLRKHTPKRGWLMVVDEEQGQEAITDYRLMGSADGLSWLELKPRTGRTHQIRIHCATMGCPLLGEPLYGRQEGDLPPGEPLHLHARSVSIPLYWPKKPPVVAIAPVPPHMQAALTRCGYQPEP